MARRFAPPHLCREWGNRSVDALDQLFRRLVLAAQAADALARPLDVGEILDTLAPYGSARRDGLIETNDDYLQLVMRLVAGERGYLFADELLQDDLKAELATPDPDLGLLRTYLNATVRLGTSHVERVLAGDTVIDLRPPTPGPAAARASGARTPAGATAAAPTAATPTDGTDPDTQPRDTSDVFVTTTVPPATTGTPQSGCPYCAQPLPEGRPLKFCPSCGLNLLVRRCSGCSAEIESGWKFCVTCGRAAS
jgi:hypothetical protein